MLGQASANNFGTTIELVEEVNHITWRHAGFARRSLEVGQCTSHDVIEEELATFARKLDTFHLLDINDTVFVQIDRGQSIFHQAFNILLLSSSIFFIDDKA